jgi:hypothetical protein
MANLDDLQSVKARNAGIAARTMGNVMAVGAAVGFFALISWSNWISAWISIFAQLIGPIGIVASAVLAVLALLRGRRLDAGYCIATTIAFAITAYLLARAAHSELVGG